MLLCITRSGLSHMLVPYICTCQVYQYSFDKDSSGWRYRNNFVRPFHTFLLTAAQFHWGNGNITQLMYTVSLDHIWSYNVIYIYICEPSRMYLIAKYIGRWEYMYIYILDLYFIHLKLCWLLQMKGNIQYIMKKGQ